VDFAYEIMFLQSLLIASYRNNELLHADRAPNRACFELELQLSDRLFSIFALNKVGKNEVTCSSTRE